MVKKKVRKGEATVSFGTSFNARSVITLIVIVFLFIGLIFLLKTYSSLIGGEEVVVNTPEDLLQVKQQLQKDIVQLQTKVGELRALVT